MYYAKIEIRTKDKKQVSDLALLVFEAFSVYLEELKIKEAKPGVYALSITTNSKRVYLWRLSALVERAKASGLLDKMVI